MGTFVMNGYIWNVYFVSSKSSYLVDRTNTLRLATTDPKVLCIYLSKRLSGDDKLLRRVLLHELGHCVMFSYGLLSAIHSFVSPHYWVEAEEWVCNFIADYGEEVLHIANNILTESYPSYTVFTN